MLKAEVRFTKKINHFDHDRISGWCARQEEGALPGRTGLELWIDGQRVEEVRSDRFRGELSKKKFRTRNLGFITRVPFAFWDGRPHAVALRSPEGETVHEQDLTPPDARLAPERGLFGIGGWGEGCGIEGWVALQSAEVAALPEAAAAAEPPALELTLEADGEEIARTAARPDTGTGPAGSLGWRFLLPADLFDERPHRFRVLVHLPEGPVEALRSQRRLQAADRPAIPVVLDPPEPGCIAGEVRNPFAEAEPLELALLVDGRERLRGWTRPEAGGRFAFRTEEAGEMMLDGGGAAAIVAVGLAPLEGLAPDWLRRSAILVTERGATAAGWGWRLRLSAPLRPAVPAAAWLRTGAGEPPRPVALAPGEDPFSLVAPLEAAPEAPCELCLGPDPEAPLLRLTESRAAPVPGPLRAPGDPDLPGALARLRQDAGTAWRAAATPGTALHWQLLGDSRVAGWAVDLDRPGCPLEVEILLDGEPVMRLRADRPVPPPLAAGCPVEELPLGFSADLDGIEVAEGAHALELRLPGAETEGAAAVLAPRRLHGPLPPAERLVAAVPALPGDAARAWAEDRRSPAAAEIRAALTRLFEGREPEAETAAAESPDGSAAAAPPLATVLAAALRRAGEPDGLLDRLLSKARPLPHQLRLGPFRPAVLAPLTARLPLAAAARERLAAARSWPAALAVLLGDPAWPADLLEPALPQDALILQKLADLGRTGTAAEGPGDVLRLPLDPGDAATSPPAALAAPGLVRGFDAEGRPLGPPVEATGPEEALAALRAAEEARRDGPLYARLGPAGAPRLYRVDWRAGAGGGPRAAAELTVTAIAAEGNLAEIHCTGTHPGAALWLRIGAAEGLAQEVAAKQEAGRTRRFVLRGDVPAAPGRYRLEAAEDGYELRIGHAGGPPPAGRPDGIEVGPGRIAAAEPVIAGGALRTGLTASRGDIAALEILLHPPAVPDSGAAPDPDAAEAEPRVLARHPLPAPDGLAPVPLALPLPDALLDGAAHEVSLVAVPAVDADADGAGTPGGAAPAPVTLWSGRIETTAALLLAQLTDFDSAAACHGFLRRLAGAGRADVLAPFLENPQLHGRHGLDPEQFFDLLALLRLRTRPEDRPEGLETLFDALWTHATGKSHARKLQLQARATLLRAEPGDIRTRYPLSPISEAATDLLLTQGPADEEQARAMIADALALRRFALARSLLAATVAKFKTSPVLGALRARLALMEGDYAAAETAARAVLAQKSKDKQALAVMTQILSRQGRTLEAAALLSEGRGLSAWLDRPPAYEQLKILAPLDWVGLIRDGLEAAGRAALLDQLGRGTEVAGPAPLPGEEGYSLFYLPPVTPPEPLADLFAALAGTGCTQAAVPDGRTMTEIECTGRWALVLTRPVPVPPALVGAIFAQLRPQETVARLETREIAASGLPGPGQLAGALIRADMLRAFGAVALPEFLAGAGRALRVKSLIV